MKKDMEKWENDDGITFLKKIGVKKGCTVMDFGARVGHYSIPAALAVGESGLIYAVDKQQDSLEELNRKAKHLNLQNIKTLRTDGRISLELITGSMDVILLYDVLHYLSPEERTELYSEAFRLLKNSGILSVYPKHVQEDHPMDEFGSMSLDDVKAEIENAGLKFSRKHCGTISHDDFLNYGCVLNFTK